MAYNYPIEPLDHGAYMEFALSLAKESPPKPTNFRVGAVLVDEGSNRILATGYTLELEGNTHAEQCCFRKFAQAEKVPEEQVGQNLPRNSVLYTTMEPCNERSVGNMPCVDRILQTLKSASGGVKTVYLGVAEPQTFVSKNSGRSKLEAAGVVCIEVPGFEKEILEVATIGHTKAE
ncbi:MAG: hypothetical protein Q9191_002965 [Dirinaria sp. TL-2023a]